MKILLIIIINKLFDPFKNSNSLSRIFCDAFSRSASQLSNSSLQWFTKESNAESKISSTLNLLNFIFALSFINPRDIKDNSRESDLLLFIN